MQVVVETTTAGGRPLYKLTLPLAICCSPLLQPREPPFRPPNSRNAPLFAGVHPRGTHCGVRSPSTATGDPCKCCTVPPLGPYPLFSLPSNHSLGPRHRETPPPCSRGCPCVEPTVRPGDPHSGRGRPLEVLYRSKPRSPPTQFFLKQPFSRPPNSRYALPLAGVPPRDASAWCIYVARLPESWSSPIGSWATPVSVMP